MQSATVDMGHVVSLYNSLVAFIDDCREDYDKYDEEGKGFSGHDEYATSRKKKRKLPFDELQTGQCFLSARDEFRVNTFL